MFNVDKEARVIVTFILTVIGIGQIYVLYTAFKGEMSVFRIICALLMLILGVGCTIFLIKSNKSYKEDLSSNFN